MKAFVICFLAIILPDLCAARYSYRGSGRGYLNSRGAGLVAGCVIAGFILLLICCCIVKKCKRKPKVAASAPFVQQQPTWNQPSAPYDNKFSPYSQPQVYEPPPPPYSAAIATRPYV